MLIDMRLQWPPSFEGTVPPVALTSIGVSTPLRLGDLLHSPDYMFIQLPPTTSIRTGLDPEAALPRVAVKPEPDTPIGGGEPGAEADCGPPSALSGLPAGVVGSVRCPVCLYCSLKD